MQILNRIGKVLTTEISLDTRSKKNENSNENHDFLYFLKQRRTVRHLGKKVILSRAYLTQLITTALQQSPSVMDCQSSRIVILLDQAHFNFWEMVKTVQKQHLPEQIAESAVLKVQQCSEAYGTILFFEDQDVINQLMKQKPLQAEEIMQWAEQSSGMSQFAVWIALSSVGLGAMLQHYNPAIDDNTKAMFDLPQLWKFKSQMVFGSIQQPPIAKQFESSDQICHVFDR